MSLHPAYSPQNWHSLLIMVGIATTSCVVTVFGKKKLPVIVILLVVYHMVLFVGVIATLLASKGPKASNAFVWSNQVSLGGWNDRGISFCIGLVNLSFTVVGELYPP